MKSAIYRGDVRHRRFRPVAHAFRFPLFMMYLDLAELPAVFAGRWIWSMTRPALARFRRADYLGPANIPLDDAVRSLVEERLGFRPAGPIRLLTHLRYLGVLMNPVSFYFCFDAEGERLEAIVAEITNTPWGERHSYVLDRRAGDAAGTEFRHRFTKAFHVSPFMPMNQSYACAARSVGRPLRLTLAVALGIYWHALRLWRKRTPFHAHPPKEVPT